MHDFTDSTISQCDTFGEWLEQLAVDRSITVCVEILSASGSECADERTSRLGHASAVCSDFDAAQGAARSETTHSTLS